MNKIYTGELSLNTSEPKLIRYFRKGCVKVIENESTDDVKYLVNKLDCYQTKSNIINSIYEGDFEVLADDVDLTRILLKTYFYKYDEETLSNPFFDPEGSLSKCIDILSNLTKHKIDIYLKKHGEEDFKKDDLIKFIQNVEII